MTHSYHNMTATNLVVLKQLWVLPEIYALPIPPMISETTKPMKPISNKITDYDFQTLPGFFE